MIKRCPFCDRDLEMIHTRNDIIYRCPEDETEWTEDELMLEWFQSGPCTVWDQDTDGRSNG
jgi:hypothetical protein